MLGENVNRLNSHYKKRIGRIDQAEHRINRIKFMIRQH